MHLNVPCWFSVLYYTIMWRIFFRDVLMFIALKNLCTVVSRAVIPTSCKITCKISHWDLIFLYYFVSSTMHALHTWKVSFPSCPKGRNQKKKYSTEEATLSYAKGRLQFSLSNSSRNSLTYCVCSSWNKLVCWTDSCR